jgi:hypothetical protein
MFSDVAAMLAGSWNQNGAVSAAVAELGGVHAVVCARFLFALLQQQCALELCVACCIFLAVCCKLSIVCHM